MIYGFIGFRGSGGLALFGVRGHLLPPPRSIPASCRALFQLETPGESEVWDTVVEFIAPFGHLRHAVQAWAAHPNAVEA